MIVLESGVIQQDITDDLQVQYTQLVPEDMIVIPSVTVLFAASFRNMNVPISACLSAQ
jgi:hypothetical protein